MPVYNGEKYLHEALDSILGQTYTDFELIIINDGSSDKTEKIILEYTKRDARIKYIQNEVNLGLVPTLNKGLGIARGDYIARMDADDICHPERLQKQIDFMKKNPNIMICGTSYKSIGAKNNTHILPEKHEEIKVGQLFGPCICHPSVFIRSSFLKKADLRYYPDTFPAEDYKLWVLAAKVGQLHNLQEVLLYYREHAAQISTENKHWQKEQTDKIRLEMLDWLYPGFSNEEKQYHINFFVPSVINTKEDFKPFKKWISKLVNTNYENGNFNKTSLKRRLKYHLKITTLRWVQAYYFKHEVSNFNRLIPYWRSGFLLKVSLRQNIKFILQSIPGLNSLN